MSKSNNNDKKHKPSKQGIYSSDILRDKHSHVSAVKNNPACNMCLVAVFEFAAANFCNTFCYYHFPCVCTTSFRSSFTSN